MNQDDDDDKSDNSGKDSDSILNDFCLLQIFNQLNINDLCCMVNVSKQFKRISMMSFGTRYKSLDYPNDLLPSKKTKSKMRRVLCNFGHLIQSLQLTGGREREFYPIEMDVISKHCAGTLKEFTLKRFDSLDCGLAKPLFALLNILKIKCRDFEGDADGLFKGCVNLKILEITNEPFTEFFSGFVQKFPKLEDLSIHTFPSNFEAITNLLQLNPQIKKLQIFDHNANRSICPLASKMENLEQLSLRCGLDTYDNIDELGKLKSLKVLELHCLAFEFIPAIEAMQNIALERLTWFDCPTNIEFMNSILKLKTLKYLTLRTISRPFDNFLTKLAEELPLLTELELGFEHLAECLFSIEGLTTLIDRSSKLRVIAIKTNYSNVFNQKFYDSMLRVVRKWSHSKRLEIKIEGK